MTYAYQLNNIIYRYKQSIALSLPVLNIESGQITALVGSNGSGKSTLLNLLAFLTFPEQGEIQFFNSTVTLKQHLQYRKCIGFLAQKPYMLRGTVLDNITLPLKMHGVRKSDRQNKAWVILEQLDIAHCAEQQAKNLSGGELQKVALARILIQEPRVLLLDEPFSYLDQQSNHLLENFIASYAQQPAKTLIFSTHNRLQGLALANNVISLVDGKSVLTPLINLFQGTVKNHSFDTGKITITLPDHITKGSHISIDPGEIVISKRPLSSSMRNNYTGRITTITEERGNVRITLAAGEKFHALITHQALYELDLNLGDNAWINFKSNCVVVF